MTHSTKHILSSTSDTATIAMQAAPFAAPAKTVQPSLSGTSTTWTSTAGGNFNTAANWSNGVPVAGINATINEASTDPITVTLSGVSDTADSLSTQYAGLSLTNATLTLQGALNGNDGSFISTGATTALTQAGGLLDFQNGPSGNDTSAITSGGAAIIQTSGTIEVDAGTLAVSGNSNFAGTLTGLGGGPNSGIVQLTGGATYTFAAGAVLSVGQVSLINASTMILGESLTYKGNFVQSGGTTLNIGAHVLTLADTAGTSSSIAGLVAGAQLTNQSALSVNGATLSSGTTLSNSGTLLFNAGGGLALGNGGIAPALLASAAGGTIAVQTGNSTIAGGTLTNAGLLQLGDSGNLTTTSTLTNTGTISIAAGDTMNVNGTLSSAGSVIGAGLFELSGNNTDALRAGTSIGAGEFELNGFNGALTVNSNIGTFKSATVFLLGTVNLNMAYKLAYSGAFIDEGNAGVSTINMGSYTLALSGTNSFDATNFGYDIFTGTGTLLLSGTSTVTQSGLAIGEGTTLSNTGTFDQASGVQLGDTNGIAFATNAATGTWDVIGDATLGGSAAPGPYSNSNVFSTFSNAGTFEMTATGHVATINALFSNTGLLTTAAGAVTDVIDNLTNSGTLAGAGALDITAGTTTLGTGTVLSVGTLAATGSSTLNFGKSLSYAGAFTEASSAAAGLNLGGNTLTLTGATTLGGYNTTTVIDGAGTLLLASASTTLAGNSTLVLGDAAVLTNTGNVTQDGTLQIGDNAGTSASVTNSAGGTWTLALGNGIARGANFATQFTNAGLFQDSELGSATNVYAVFNNNATVSVTGTELDFNSTFVNKGKLTGTGAIGLRGSAVGTLAAGTGITVAQVNLYDSSTLNIAANVTYAGIFNDEGYQGTTLNLGAFTLTLSKTAYFGSVNNIAYVDGTGTLSLTAASTATITNTNNGLEIGGTMKLLNAGKLTQNGQFQIGDSSGASATVTNTATGTWSIATGAGIGTGSNASSSFTNLGHFQNTGAGVTQNIGAVLNNSGTIGVAAGDTTAINNLLTNTGTISGAGQIAINGTADFNAGEVISIAEISLTNTGTLNLATNLTYAGIFNDQGYNGTSLNIGTNTLSLTGTAVFGSVNNAAFASGTGTLAVSGATTITASNQGLALGGSLGMVNTGSVLQNGQLTIGDSSGALASVTNSSTWTIATGAGISTGSNSSSSFTNNGLLQVTAAAAQNISAVLANAGTLSVAAGDSFTINNLLTNTGTLSGAGALAINGTATFSAGSVLSIGQIGLYNTGTLNIGTNLTYAGFFNDQGYNGATLNLGANKLSLTGVAIFGSVNNAALVTGTGTLSLGGTTTITSANQGMALGGTTALVNSGTVTQAGSLQIGDGSGNIATVTNSATGTWKLGTSNIISTGNNTSSSFSNAGLVVNIGTGNTERITAVFNNTGTLTDTAAGSTIALAGGGSIGGTLAGAGEIDFDNGGIYTLATGTALGVASLGLYNNGTDLALAGAASYAGTLTEGAGATINLGAAAAKLTLTGQDTLNGSVTGSGTLVLSAGGVLIADNLTLGGSAVLQDSGGTIAQSQSITIGNNAASTASLSIAAGSTYSIVGNVTIASQGTGAITNAGSFAMQQGTGTATVAPLFTNTGTVASNSGTLVFTSGFTNNKLVTAINGHEVVFDSSVNATGAASGTISLTSGGMALFGGYVGSAETLSFTDGSSSAATLASPSNFDGTISGFSGSNALTLGDFENASATYSGGVLALTGVNDSGTATTVDLHFAGSYTLASFTISNNGSGGTLIVDPKH
jgi:hypothetical protein